MGALARSTYPDPQGSADLLNLMGHTPQGADPASEEKGVRRVWFRVCVVDEQVVLCDVCCWSVVVVD